MDGVVVLNRGGMGEGRFLSRRGRSKEGLFFIFYFLVLGIALQMEGRKEMFYLTTHSTYFIYGYMASDIW